MALLSPGVEVTVIDESFFAPVVSTSIPYILLATAQDKTNSTGAVALGTTLENANLVTPITSRRELVTLFGNPTFTPAASGGVVQAHELSEYGLQVAYSVLGVTNRIFVQRADIDLSELTGTSVRPTNTPANGTLWLDLADTDWGLFEWNVGDQTFNKITPIIITDLSDTVGGSGNVPEADIGTIGSYAVIPLTSHNPVFHKNLSGAWHLVGSATWQVSNFTIQGTATSPTLTTTENININTVDVTISGTTIDDMVTAINALTATTLPGVTALEVNSKLEIYATDLSESDGASADGIITLDVGGGNPGTLLADLGLIAGDYNRPTVQLSAHTSVPEWKSGDGTLPAPGIGNTARPSGSVWVKTTSPNLGADFEVNLFNAVTSEFNRVTAPLYSTNAAANNALDAVGGGVSIPTGSLYFRYDTVEDGTITYSLYERLLSGSTNITGNAPSLPVAFNQSDTFTVQVSVPGSDTLTVAATITLSNTTASDFVQDIINENIANLTASINGTGQIVFTHEAGGSIYLREGLVGTPILDAGFSSALAFVEDGNLADQIVLSNWVQPSYTASLTQPSVDPVDGTKWYFSAVDEVDLMMHDGTDWRGYQNVTSDARNYDLSATNPEGPFVSASEPLLQSDGTAIVFGDIWIDTSVINDYPIINRWTDLGGSVSAWVVIDNADATSENGIVFLDARWDGDFDAVVGDQTAGGNTDPITDDIPTIVTLLTSDYVDLDAPDSALYPRGTILWNTRRSGFNVKQYAVDYFNATAFAGVLPTVTTSTWRTVSGLKLDGSPYMGSNAVRNMVVQAMKGGIDASLTVREENTTINLLTAPFYPELIANLSSVNVDRKETAFVVGDSPMTLAATSLALANWASNANLAPDNGVDGLVSTSEYLGVYYPSGLSNDLEGNAVVVPSSHMSLRTIIRSDNVSYPWIAPAGVRRGKVDNATAIGYVDIVTGEFQSIALGEGLRDVLYTNNVNPISILPGSGITVYGQKTRSGIASSLDRINVARLTANLRFVLALLSRPFIFEPNDKLTRDEFKNEIEKFLNELVAKRGIFDYLVVCDETNNTPARIDRNELWADVAIEPVKAAEFIFVPLRLKNTGEI